MMADAYQNVIAPARALSPDQFPYVWWSSEARQRPQQHSWHSYRALVRLLFCPSLAEEHNYNVSEQASRVALSETLGPEEVFSIALPCPELVLKLVEG